VLASAVPRLDDLVEDGGSGLLVSNTEPAAWADALRTLASDPMRRERWGRRGRELAEQRFSWPEIGAHFEALLLRAIQQHRAGASEPAAAVPAAQEASPLAGSVSDPSPS